jgi:integrase
MNVTFHDSRHACASIAAHGGVPIHALSEILGHSNIAVTLSVYVHLYERERAEDAFRLAMKFRLVSPR